MEVGWFAGIQCALQQLLTFGSTVVTQLTGGPFRCHAISEIAMIPSQKFQKVLVQMQQNNKGDRKT